MGFWNYFGDKFNVFDFLINMISIIEIILVSAACVPHAATRAKSRSVVMTPRRSPPACRGNSDNVPIDATVFRVLRLVRVCRALKIVQKWKSMKHILNAVAASGPGLVNFCCLLRLFAFIYSLCGMQRFAAKFNEKNGWKPPPAPKGNKPSPGKRRKTALKPTSRPNSTSQREPRDAAEGEYFQLQDLAKLEAC